MVAAELRRGGTRVRRAEATKMDLDDEIFESFFACVGSVKEAKVCVQLKWFSTTQRQSKVLSGFWDEDELLWVAGSSE